MSETFRERLTRLCQERGVSSHRVYKASGLRVDKADRSKTISLASARKIADTLGMSVAELDAPVSLVVETGRAVALGLIEE